MSGRKITDSSPAATASSAKAGSAEPTPPPVLWRCPPERLAGSPLAEYMRWLEREHGVRFEDYNELWRWSVAELETFWESIWRFFDVRCSRPYDRVLARREMPGAEWFPGAELNFAEHCFRGHDLGEVAIVHESELREMGEWTWQELRTRSAAIAAGLRALGVQPGDRVAAYLPNVPEAVAAFLACASIGAGLVLVLAGLRLAGGDRPLPPDCTARAPGGRRIPLRRPRLRPYRDRAGAASSAAERRAHGHLELSEPGIRSRMTATTRSCGGSSRSWATASPWSSRRCRLTIRYGSSTAQGPPAFRSRSCTATVVSCSSSSSSSTCNSTCVQGDRFFWFSTTGWVMWNVVVSALLTPASIVLYDGSPADPDQDRLWALADRAGVSCFGASAAFLSGCMKAGLDPAAGGRLSRLKSIGSTGSPLPPEVFRWVYERFGARAMAVFHQWRNRHRRCVRRRRADDARLRGGDQCPDAGRQRRVLGHGWPPPRRSHRRAGGDSTDAVDADRAVGR